MADKLVKRTILLHTFSLFLILAIFTFLIFQFGIVGIPFLIGTCSIVILHHLPMMFADIKMQSTHNKGLFEVMFAQKDPDGKSDFIVFKNYSNLVSRGFAISTFAIVAMVALTDGAIWIAIISYLLAFAASYSIYRIFVNMKV